MRPIKLYLTAIILTIIIVTSSFGVIADDQIRPASQTESRGVGEQIRPANQQSLPTDGNGDYHPSEGSSYSSSENNAPPVIDTIKLKAVLNGTNINSTTNVTGNASFSLNENSNTLSYSIEYDNLSSNETGLEIIIPDLLVNDSNNNTVSYIIDLGTFKQGVVSFMQEVESYLLDGKALIKIRSLLFPNGEIGGEIKII